MQHFIGLASISWVQFFSTACTVMNINSNSVVQHKVTDTRREAYLSLGEGAGPDVVPSVRRAAGLIDLSSNSQTHRKSKHSVQ